MRFVLHNPLPADRFNQAVLDGSAGEKINRIIEDTKPEAADFCAKEGKRGGFLIVDMAKTSEMPRLAEPWFLYFDATVEFLPAMTLEDLQKGGFDEHLH